MNSDPELLYDGKRWYHSLHMRMADHYGRCGLCLETRDLRESHLLPSAVYKLARTPSRTDPNPVVVRRGRSFTTSRQVSCHFLCSDCEHRFSRNGERYVLSQCARPSGDFKLREFLLKSSPLYSDPHFKVYEVGSLLGNTADQYLYLAASVFWRASAHSWTMDGQPVGGISLGAEYQEQFRLYLLGKAGFPSNARVFVHVWSERHVDLTTVFPCTFRLDRARRHKFCIPGILFILFLGQDVSKAYDAWALNSTQGHFMWLCPWSNDSLFRGCVRAIGRSKPSAHLIGQKTRPPIS